MAVIHAELVLFFGIGLLVFGVGWLFVALFLLLDGKAEETELFA